MKSLFTKLMKLRISERGIVDRMVAYVMLVVLMREEDHEFR
jgi:hypothetical protein